MRLSALAVALLLAGCPTETPDGPAEFVLHIPAADSVGIPPSTDITAEWTAPVTGVSVTVLVSAQTLDGELNQVRDGSVWAWIPDDELVEETLHEVVIDWDGAPTPLSFGFTTGEVGWEIEPHSR